MRLAAAAERVRQGALRAGAPRLARSAGWLGVACLGLGALLSFPRAAAGGAVQPPLRAVLLDASASATRGSSAWHLWARGALRDEALAARAAGEELAVVRFAADLELYVGPAPPDGWLARLEGRAGEPIQLRRGAPADLGSDLAGALELVAGDLTSPARPPGRVALLGDGRSTGRDPAPILARLARAGVRVEQSAPPAADVPDLALVELTLPRAPSVGEPLAASLLFELRLGSDPLERLHSSARARVEVSLDSSAGLRAFELPLELPSSGFGPALRFRTALDLGRAEPGRTLVRVRARLEGTGALRAGDAAPENDTLAAVARAGGARLAAAVGEADALPFLRGWIARGGRFPGLQWIACTPAELAGLVPELDLLVSFDLSHAALPRAAVEAFVRGGGGWLFCGGWGLLRDWGTHERGLAELLPIDLGRPGSDERDVLLLIDGSGSMAGEPFERVKQALVELVDAALPGDRIHLRFFTAALAPAQELTAPEPSARRRALARLLETRVPGGPTAVLDSLEQLAVERAGARRPALVILLSDGRDRNAFDVEQRSAALRASFAASATQLSVIAAGRDADLALLGALLPPGTAPAIAEDLGDLGELFQREILRERVREGERLAVVPAAPDELDELPAARAALEAQLARPATEWPRMSRYARGTRRPSASQLWSGVEGEPVLALQRVGAGLVAAWTTGPLADWAPEWADADDLLGPLLRALARPAEQGEPGRLAVEGDLLELRGVPADWPARVEARCFAPAVASAFAGSGLEAELGRVELSPPTWGGGPDLRARRSAPRPAWLARAPAGAALRVELADPGSGAALGQLALTAPRPAELDPAFPGHPLRLVAPRAAAERPVPASAATSSGASVLLLAGCVLVAASALGGRRGRPDPAGSALRGTARGGAGFTLQAPPAPAEKPLEPPPVPNARWRRERGPRSGRNRSGRRESRDLEGPQ